MFGHTRSIIFNGQLTVAIKQLRTNAYFTDAEPVSVFSQVTEQLEQVCLLKPDRIAFYAYAHVPWIKPGQRRFTEADLPAGDRQ